MRISKTDGKVVASSSSCDKGKWVVSGIFGYIGTRQPFEVLLRGLREVQHKGYDSCGIAIVSGGETKIVRAVGSVSDLETKVRQLEPIVKGLSCAIGETLWITRARPTQQNAPPYQDCTARFIIVQNGILENVAQLKGRLASEGHHFLTDTQTELIAHLIESRFKGDLLKAVQATMQEIEGSLAIVAVSSADGLKLIAAQSGSPLMMGIGENENFIASDMLALLPFTSQIIHLADGETAIISNHSVKLTAGDGSPVLRDAEHIAWSADSAALKGHRHYMSKEIFEQPDVIRDTLRGRADLTKGVTLEYEIGPAEIFRPMRNVVIVGCGSSRHAALVGEFFIESFARLHVDVDYASEFRYRDPLLGPDTLVVAVTQSGETADTLGAMHRARDKGAFVLSICNVPGSTAARIADSTLYTRAGPEIAVPSSKTFTTELVVFYLLGLFLASARAAMNQDDIRGRLRLLNRVPEQIERVLDKCSVVEALAGRLCEDSPHVLYLGRGINFPIALEGALKLKQVSYMSAEAYPSAEIKHGPIALIDKTTPVVLLAPRDSFYTKALADLEEVKARDGFVFAIAAEGDRDIVGRTDYAVQIPEADPFSNPFLTVVPLQLLAYYEAVLRGIDADRPRNLAKGVIVE